MARIFRRLLMGAVVMGGALLAPLPATAQTALNQVRLVDPVTSVTDTVINVTVADSIAVGDVVYVDREAMTTVSRNTTTDTVTVRRGQLGTRADLHPDDAIVWSGPADDFYYYSPSGRCTAGSAYPGGAQPWINLLTGEVWFCDDNIFGVGAASYWRGMNMNPMAASRLPYTPIAFRTGGSPVTTNVPAYTILLSDVLIASMTYSGAFELFLPSPTGLLGKRIIVSDFAQLAGGSPQGRTIIVRGLGDTVTSWPIGIVGATTSFYVGISASSMFSWAIGW